MTQAKESIRLARWPDMAGAISDFFLGWSTRTYSASLPQLIDTYAPDTLWALLVFLLVAVKLGIATERITLIALRFAYGIELSQLYQAPWINAIRATGLGGLVLRHGSLWSDLICYSAGITCGVIIDRGLRRRSASKT